MKIKTTFKEYNEALLYEFNRMDKEVIQSLDKYFTIAVEYELCLNESPDDEPPIDDYEKSAKFAKQATLLQIKRAVATGYILDMSTKEIEEFVDNIIDEVLYKYDDDDDDDIYDELLNVNNYDTDTEKFIIDAISGFVMRYFDSQNMEYLKKRLKQSLPNFYKKYSKSFKFELEGDDEKQRILEFSPKTYINGLNLAIEQLNDFFDEFEKQDVWYFNDRTALHINIGVKNNLNPLKGILLLSDLNRDKKIPHVFKGIESRFDNVYVGSMIDKLIKLLLNELNKKEFKNKRNWSELKKYKKYLTTNINKLDLHNLSELEAFLNELLLKINIDFWVKEFGLNIIGYKQHYVEFRFIGGNIPRELVLDKLNYFAYITYAMSDPEYKRKQYINRLYKFVEELKEIIKKP